jgi:hypothetical protein
LPYVFIDSGLGNISYDNDPAKRYVGLLRYIYDLLISESRDYSISDIVLARNSFPWFTIEGEHADEVVTIAQKYGQATRLPAGTKVIPQVSQVPPEELNRHLDRTSNYIAAHAAPRSTQGLGEQGVRSGADRRLVLAEAASRYKYATDAFRFGTARVLTNCARIIKNVVKENVRVWARTPYGEFDAVIEPADLIEPFTCSVEFAPISEEDEYRRHDDWERLLAARIVTQKWVREHMSNVDADSMELEEAVESLRNDPNLNSLISQYVTSKMAQAITTKEAADNPAGVAQQMAQAQSPTAPGQPPTNQGMAQGQPGRRLVPPSSPKPVPGSAGALQNQMNGLRSQTPMNPMQGQGGGGNRP